MPLGTGGEFDVADDVVALAMAERRRLPAATEENELPAAVGSGFVSLVGDEVRAYLS